MDFVAIDVETTGTLSHVDHIVEIAALQFHNKDVVQRFTSLINPGIPIPKEASQINGITDDMVKNQPSIDDVLPSFAEICGRHCLIAHNAIFDFQFLSAAIEKHQCKAPTGPMLDTYALSRITFPGMHNYKLATLSEHHRITSHGFHRAQQDAWACGRLFYEIMIRLQPQMNTAYSDSSEPILNIKKIVNLSGKKELHFPSPAIHQFEFFD